MAEGREEMKTLRNGGYLQSRGGGEYEVKNNNKYEVKNNVVDENQQQNDVESDHYEGKGNGNENLNENSLIGMLINDYLSMSQGRNPPFSSHLSSRDCNRVLSGEDLVILSLHRVD